MVQIYFTGINIKIEKIRKNSITSVSRLSLATNFFSAVNIFMNINCELTAFCDYSILYTFFPAKFYVANVMRKKIASIILFLLNIFLVGYFKGDISTFNRKLGKHMNLGNRNSDTLCKRNT